MRFDVAAILFDIDGTLVDSTPAVVRTWTAWAHAYGLDPDDILRVSHGRRSQDTIADFLPAAEVAAAHAELERLEPVDLHDVAALPASAELLAALPQDRWAAVTSGPRELMRARLQAAGLPVPEVLVAAEDVTIGKPHPQGYQQAADALGYPAHACLVIEDSPAGIAAGRAAGAGVLGVATSHPAEVLDADSVITDLTGCSIEVGRSGLIVTST